MKRLVLVGIIVLVVATLPVAAHGNSIEADTQTSTDGTVTIELLTAVTDGFVVLHEANGDEIGSVVGFTDPGEGPIHTDLTLEIEDAYWQTVTNHTTLHAVLHRNEGDSSFDPSEDPMQESASGDLVSTKFTVGKAEENRSLVLAEADHAQEVNSSAISVRRVELASDGYFVIRANDNGNTGEIVGQTALSAGKHTDVTIDIDDHFYSHRDERFSLWAVLHRSNGDGTFEPTADPAVTVDGAPIQTILKVHRTGEVEPQDHGTPSPTQTATSTHDADDHSHTETSTETPTPNAETVTPDPRTESSEESTLITDSQTTTAQSPGFTILLGLFSLVAFLIATSRPRN